MSRPKPLATDKRWPIWIQFLLGTAGIAVSATGMYELAGRKPMAAAQEVIPAPSPYLDDLTRLRQIAGLQEAERQAKIAEIRRLRLEAARQVDDLKRRGARCIDGVWIVKEGNAISSHGRCTQ